MASPSVTYTFTNSTTADGPQVSQNFTDIINGITDGTKDLSINALTCAGSATFNGNTTLGNASGDTLTVTASLASSISIGTTYSYDIGASTVGLRKLYLGASDSAARTVALNAGAVTSSYTLSLPVAVPSSAKSVMTFTTSGAASFEHRTTTTTTSISVADTPYTALATDEVILVTAAGGAVTVNLPAAASSTGKTLLIKRTDQTLANVVTIDGNASETIDGATTRTLATKYESLRLACDGSNWHVLDHLIDSTRNSVTITGSWSANTTYTAFWLRRGDTMILDVKVATSGAPTSAALTITLPATIDTSKLSVGTGADQSMGRVAILDSGTTSFTGYVKYASTTTLAAYVGDVATYQRISNAVTQAVPMTFANGDHVHIIAEFPVVGWDG